MPLHLMRSRKASGRKLPSLKLPSFLARAALIAGPATAAEQSLYQLRIYQIFEPNKAAFHARFRDHAARIMRKYDFDIVSMWESKSPERTEFVYVVRWPDEATMKDRWTKFMADDEWARIKKETSAAHGTLVGDIQERILRAVDYSPGQWR